MSVLPILSNAVNGLHKNAERVQDSANRIVNLNTRPEATIPVSYQPNVTGSNAIDAQVNGSGQVDLVVEFVNIIQAEIAYKANAEVLKTAESLSDYTRDILA